MVYATYSSTQAVTRARAVSRWTTNMCLNFVFHCVTEKSAGLYDANAAWTAARQKVTRGVPPAGAPVYFQGGKHGHIALSVGGGKIRSTDWRTGYGFSAGSVGEATINDVAMEFFGTTSAYRGWSRDYAGQIIRGLEETTTNYSPPPVVAPKEDFMSGLTDAEQRDFYNKVDVIYKRTLGGIPDGKAAGRTVNGVKTRVLDTALPPTRVPRRPPFRF